MELYKQLKVERISRELTRLELSEYLDSNGVPHCSEALIKKWESDPDYDIDVRALVALSDLFKVPCDDLINPTVDPVKKLRNRIF